MMERKPIEVQLTRILSHIRQDYFGGRNAPEVRLRDGTKAREDGALIGGFDVVVRTRSGETALLHTQSLEGVADEKTLKDAFAAALSIVLANHAKWPR